MRTNTSKIILLTIFSLFIVNKPSHAFMNKTKITIHVVDEDGGPIENARVGIGFEKTNGEEDPAVGYTNNLGKFTVSNKNATKYIGFNITKDAFYKTTGNFTFKSMSMGRWQPWNPEMKVVLRPINKPVPMYARNSSTSKKDLNIPVVGEPIGFDLMKFDWVVPYGQGVNPDFIFKLEKTFKNRNDFYARIVLTFSNKYDGIQIIKEDLGLGSEFKLPYKAPNEGYKNEIVISKSSSPSEYINISYENNDNYVFRVRSEVKDGKLIRAMYGKILGPIRIDPIFSNTTNILFKYYLNPDYSRNLEFDPERNLFGSLPLLEQVGIK